MIGATLLARLPAREQALALLTYMLAVVGLVATTWLALAGLGERYTTYAETADRLAKMESRRGAGARATEAGDPAIEGSPFIEATTLTIAGAELQKRVTAAIRDAGGSVLSSQIDLQQVEGTTDRVSLTESFEIDQPAVQKLLYDIEAGMPFLFVDRLTIQPVEKHGGDASGSRLRIQLSVSGQWQQAKQ